MDLLVTIILGFVIGLVARFLTPGDDKMGIILTTICGVVGSVLGKYIAGYLPFILNIPFGVYIASVLGAVLIVLLLRVFRSRS